MDSLAPHEGDASSTRTPPVQRDPSPSRTDPRRHHLTLDRRPICRPRLRFRSIHGHFDFAENRVRFPPPVFEIPRGLELNRQVVTLLA